MTLSQRLEATAKALKEQGTSVSDILIADLLLEANKRLEYYDRQLMALTNELGEQSA